MGIIEIKTTFDVEEDARKMADILINKRLVACVQIGKIESIYTWQGKRDGAKEFLLTMKTRRGLFGKVKQEILKEHPYRVPEIVAVKICCGWKDYLKWVKDLTK